MSVDNYPLLKKTLNLNVAIDWLSEDSRDDFFPDSLNFKDIYTLKSEYLNQRQHRMFQIDLVPSHMEYVSKANGMLREAIWLHPTHRILYLAILHHLLPKLDKLVPSTIYSYRLDRADDPDAYPFSNRLDRWKQFHNDFRSAALEESTGAILLTDIAAFYDHINIENLVSRIEGMLGRSMNVATRCVIQFLQEMLMLWATTAGYGIPQNLDPSSFFGSLYLHNADIDVLSKRYRYFRWVDDIRICAKTHSQALRALHDLQKVLARDRLFLASDKTKIVEKGTPEFEKMLDVEDDVVISKAEEEISKGDHATLVKTSKTLMARLNYHASPQGDDRKFRAYANRLLSVAEFEELTCKIHPAVSKFVLPRLRSHPSRSDYWAKMLLAVMNDAVITEVRDVLLTNPSLFDWQRYHLWRMLTQSSTLPTDLLEHAKSIVRVGVSTLERGQAALCVGKHGSNTDRERLFAEHFSAQSSYPVQRALIIAVQELPKALRKRLWDRAVQINSDHRQLVSFLEVQKKPYYGKSSIATRHCRKKSREVTIFLKAGVGLVKGTRTTFRLSKADYDYE